MIIGCNLNTNFVVFHFRTTHHRIYMQVLDLPPFFLKTNNFRLDSERIVTMYMKYCFWERSNKRSLHCTWYGNQRSARLFFALTFQNSFFRFENIGYRKCRIHLASFLLLYGYIEAIIARNLSTDATQFCSIPYHQTMYTRVYVYNEMTIALLKLCAILSV